MRKRWLPAWARLAWDSSAVFSLARQSCQKYHSPDPACRAPYFKAVALLLAGFIPIAASAQEEQALWTTFNPDTSKLEYPCVIVSGAEGLNGAWTFTVDAFLDKGELILTKAEPIDSVPSGCRTDSMEISSVEGIITGAILSSHNTTFANDPDRNAVFNLNLSLDMSRSDGLYFLIDLAELRNFENNLPPAFDTEGNPGDFPKQLNVEYQLPASNVPDVLSLSLPKINPDPEGDLVGLIELEVKDASGNLLFSGEVSGDTIDIPVPQTQGQSTFKFVVFPKDEHGAKGAGLETTLTLTVSAATGGPLANWDNFNWGEAIWN